MTETEKDSLDALARRFIMATWLYYVEGEAMFLDHEYDNMANFIADRFEYLSPYRKWQLVSAAEIRKTGIGIRHTQQSISGAHAWFKAETGKQSTREHTPPQTPSPVETGMDYYTLVFKTHV